MPREKITSTTRRLPGAVASDDVPPGATLDNVQVLDLAVGWNPAGRWVQVHVIPKTWRDTGDWTSFDLDPEDIDHLIRVLARAKRRALG